MFENRLYLKLSAKAMFMTAIIILLALEESLIPGVVRSNPKDFSF